MPCEAIVLPKAFQLKCLPEGEPTLRMPSDPNWHQAAELFWQQLQQQSLEPLVNDLLFIYSHQTNHIIFGQFVDYCTYRFYRHTQATWTGSLLKPIAVSGCLQSQNSLLWAKRSVGVSQYAGFWELVPSGSISQRHVESSGIIRADQQLLEELNEEVGISAREVSELMLFALVYDDLVQVYDIAIAITTTLMPQQVLDRFKANEEYEELRWITPDQRSMHPFLQHEKIVPTSLAILNIRFNLNVNKECG